MSAEAPHSTSSPIAPEIADAFSRRTPREIMAYHAKTFYWASRLFPRATCRDIETLYAFCRFVDDVADESGSLEQTRRGLESIQADLAVRKSDVPIITAFLELAQRKQLDLRIAEELVRGAASDLDVVRFADTRDLVRYGYRVASTVGLLVCGIVDVRSEQALAYAIDLGVAMQLTNIARDVIEDMERDRIYLPAEWVSAEQVRAAVEDGDEDAQAETLAAVYEVLDLAHRFYRSADQGMCYLPWWARWAILTSSRAYEAIGKVLRTRGPRYWQGRTFTRRRLKLWYTFKAGVLIALLNNLRDTKLAPRHQPRLHVELADLPHADPRAREYLPPMTTASVAASISA